ncbi:MAG: arsenic-transporting ATPase [Saprospiraceae bacterium]|nr:MAG: arsenic-transporting ATPase [Saprospiraceae bacterium]
MRIILFTGKGGVGKTTVAASTALKAAKEGKKTLIISTDPAHSLSDALDIRLSPEPMEIAPNLFAQEFDVYYSMEKYWNNMRNLMNTVFRWRGVKNVVAEELSVLPGMEEASAFLWLEKYYEEGTYDVIVIDSAPTGETLTLLSLPQVVKSWMTKAFSRKNLAVKTVTKGVKFFTGVPLDAGLEELDELFNKLEKIQQVFLDPEVASIRIVTNPERMVIKEAKRAYTYLQLYGYNVDAVIINRILPEKSVGEAFKYYIESQKGYIEEIEESFNPLPILKVQHQGQEVFGMEQLETISNSLYEGKNASDVLYLDKPYEVIENSKGYFFKTRLPFVVESDIELQKFGDELIINIGNRRKSIMLPRFASFLKLEEYRFQAPWLVISLVK